MGLVQKLRGRRIAVDTVAIIYFIEEDPAYLPLIRPLFLEAARGRREIVTSALTLLEVLVVPYRVGDMGLAERYEALLTRSRGIRLVAVDGPQLRAAAQLRAAYHLGTPDAVQLSAALSQRCTAFVTNDRALPALPGLVVIQLGELRARG